MKVVGRSLWLLSLLEGLAAAQLYGNVSLFPHSAKLSWFLPTVAFAEFGSGSSLAHGNLAHNVALAWLESSNETDMAPLNRRKRAVSTK
jgi:hypothetical protein